MSTFSSNHRFAKHATAQKSLPARISPPTVIQLLKAAIWLCALLWLTQQGMHFVVLSTHGSWVQEHSWLAPLQALLRLTL